VFTTALAEVGGELQALARSEYNPDEGEDEGWGKNGDKAWRIWAVVDLTVQTRVIHKLLTEEQEGGGDD